jgi:streptomycin 6-kinase
VIVPGWSGCDDAGVAFRLPTNLADDARRDGGERREWVLRLPDVVGELADRWSLRVGDPYEPGGSCSWVAPAQTAEGLERVLKVGWRHDEAESEADGLRAWQGHGTVVLHDAHTCGATSALLLERCRPGIPLGQAVGEPEQDVVIAGLLSRLWSAPAEGFSFRSLQVMCDTWATGFQQRLAASPTRLDPALVQAGIELWRELPGTATHNVLLATDLHAGNVLASQREPWLVIDPKPYLGDPSYDALQHMLNCDRLTTEPRRLAAQMATLLELDPKRVTQWLFARCVYESLDQPELARVAAALAPK